MISPIYLSDSVKEVATSGHNVQLEEAEGYVDLDIIEQGGGSNTITGQEHTQGIYVLKEEDQNVEVKVNKMLKVSTVLGELRALMTMFRQLGGTGVGTTRSEDISKDFVYQSILKGVDVDLKVLGKDNQQNLSEASL